MPSPVAQRRPAQKAVGRRAQPSPAQPSPASHHRQRAERFSSVGPPRPLTRARQELQASVGRTEPGSFGLSRPFSLFSFAATQLTALTALRARQRIALTYSCRRFTLVPTVSPIVSRCWGRCRCCAWCLCPLVTCNAMQSNASRSVLCCAFLRCAQRSSAASTRCQSFKFGHSGRQLTANEPPDHRQRNKQSAAKECTANTACRHSTGR